MTRYMVLKYFMRCLEDNDVAIFAGEGLSNEAYNFDRPGNFYIREDFAVAVPLSLGIAMGTNKRIFVFVGEGDLLRDLGAMVQAAVSGRRNIIPVILNNDVYQDFNNNPNIFVNLRHKHGIFFDMGFLSFNFTKYFIDAYHAKKIDGLIESLVGPVSILIEVDQSKKFPSIDISDEKLSTRFKEFVQDDSLGTSLLEPPKLDVEMAGGVANGV